LARHSTGLTTATYKTDGGRKALSVDPHFGPAFTSAKARVRDMQVRFVEENDPICQALLEIYVAIVLKTRHNDFDNH